MARPTLNARTNPAALMITLRRWHGYIGALIAPSILFFAFTGTLQLFSLHESHDGYVSPAWIGTLANVHKDQVLKKERRGGPPRARRPDAEGPPPADRDDDHDPGPAKPAAVSGAQMRSWALKWEFALVAVGLIGSTSVGLWIALQDPRRRRSTLILLAVGALAPLLTLLA